MSVLSFVVNTRNAASAAFLFLDRMTAVRCWRRCWRIHRHDCTGGGGHFRRLNKMRPTGWRQQSGVTSHTADDGLTQSIYLVERSHSPLDASTSLSVRFNDTEVCPVVLHLIGTVDGRTVGRSVGVYRRATGSSTNRSQRSVHRWKIFRSVLSMQPGHRLSPPYTRRCQLGYWRWPL